ncbi:MAG TPA: acyloxyacyl hydrolase [Terriglobales bacterium]|jgi:hypothetical protein|nr:acyloxyacyl hydrolase [Terriglobales bacterium]
MQSVYSVRCLPLLFLLLLIAPPHLRAQNAATFPLADNQLWEFGFWGGEALGQAGGGRFGDTHITMAGFHAGRVIHEFHGLPGHRKTLEYTIELQPLFLVTSPQKAYGGGFSPIGVKWNFPPRRRYRPYLEFNCGGMFTQKNVPPGNTETFNFTLALGPGVMIAMRHNQVLSVAVRYWHLSNAGIGYDNPAFNTIQIVIGYHWLTSGRHQQQQVSTAAEAQ